MPFETLMLGVVFAASMIFTPGPANLSLLSIGVSMGLARALPYLIGIWLGGFAVMVASAAGLGALLATAPSLFLALKIAGFLYICWLAYKLVRVGLGGKSHEVAPSFWAGLALHPLNPKAWVQNVMVFTGFITTGISYLPQAAILIAASMAMMMVGTSLWGLGGGVIGSVVHDSRAMRIIAIASAVAMILSVAAAFVV